MRYATLKYSNKKRFYPQKIYDETGKLNIILPRFKEKYARKYAIKINEILKEEKINELLIDKDLLKVRHFCNYLLDCDRYILTGRRIYKALVFEIFNEMCTLMNVDMHKLKVGLLLNGYSMENVELIRMIAPKVKSLVVVTTDNGYYRRIAHELYEEKGIVLKVIEKYRMNLKYANVILNVDFPSYDIQDIQVANNSLIILRSGAFL